jgi:hypothetical protein
MLVARRLAQPRHACGFHSKGSYQKHHFESVCLMEVISGTTGHFQSFSRWRNGQGSSNYFRFCDSSNCAGWQRASGKKTWSFYYALLRPNRLTTTSNSLLTKLYTCVRVRLKHSRTFCEASNSLRDNCSEKRIAPWLNSLQGQQL